MTKQVEAFVSKLRSENPEKFVGFLHSLAHALTPDEAEVIHQHSHEVHDTQIDEAARLDNIASQLELRAEQVRTGIIIVPQGEVVAKVIFDKVG